MSFESLDVWVVGNKRIAYYLSQWICGLFGNKRLTC